MGAVVATAGAFVLLFFYRLLSGFIFEEGDTRVRRRHSRRRRRYDSVAYDD
jgi:hypothetical protein